MTAYWCGVLSAFREFRPEAEEYRELDDERILVLNKWSGQGKTSAFTVESTAAKSAALIHVRDGKVTKFVTYWDRDRALADLGLQE
jgi:ketosteroid isomerase-like protein